MRLMCFIFAAITACAQTWTPQQSGVSVSLRGVSAVNSTVVWASGEKGTFLKTTDGGTTWQPGTLPGTADLDFRGLRAFSDRTAVMMAAGPGEKSRIYKTTDGGKSWSLQHTNPDPKGFYDAIAFWDDAHGIVLGDPVDGRFVILVTGDGGATWRRQKGPSAQETEGAFAASNTCLTLRGLHEAWFGTSGGRVFHSTDGGQTWSVAKTQLRNDSPNAGIFSLAFTDRAGIAVGGDYMKAADATGTAATSADSGKTWTAMILGGFRSAVEYLADRKMWVAVGTSGSDFSTDDGRTWKPFGADAYNALSGEWAVGPKGAIARLSGRTGE